jgi:predicted TIM-barrel fold metal-dependent hydrolase
MAFLGVLGLLALQVSDPAVKPAPIIDMHLHALPTAGMGPPKASICAPYEEWPIRDTHAPIEKYLGDFTAAPSCRGRLIAPGTDAEVRAQTIAVLRRRNIIGVTSGPAEMVEQYRKQAPDRILPAISFGESPQVSPAELRRLHAAGRLRVIGELTFQYDGIAPDDARIEPYYALGEELDVPVAIHIGPGPPGIPYFGSPNYRMRLSDPLALEEVLMRHPKLRLYVMHAGWPLADRMIALMFAHPQVYVDTGVISFAFPRAEFHAYLKRLVDAGFGKRIMFGSDQMIWAEAIEKAVANIESAPLTPEQKRDILYNNAARFLRLSQAEQAAHGVPRPPQ